jgi:alpha-mannosidase
MFEQWNAGNNVATQAAKDLLKPFSLKRNSIIEPRESWNNYLYCQKCRMRGVKTKYHKNNMAHYEKHYRNNGKITTVYTHYCQECNETYVPQGERIGKVDE